MYERRRGGFGRRDFDDFDKPKPVKVGQEYDVKISDVGAKGDGITKIENFIVFVPGAKKGEECRVKIKEVSNRFAIGEKVGGSQPAEETEEAGEQAEEVEAEEATEESEEEAEESGSEEEE
ncbi:MAG: TRAM domain-containing protein [Candidatus Aenigmarchaeota archaeon]|nr:TRAM domain-containing protein [Candidatus Aenigmarchaeota archaeon]